MDFFFHHQDTKKDRLGISMSVLVACCLGGDEPGVAKAIAAWGNTYLAPLGLSDVAWASCPCRTWPGRPCHKRGSAEVFGSEPNSSAAFSPCPAMDGSKFRFYEPQRKANCAYLCATGSHGETGHDISNFLWPSFRILSLTRRRLFPSRHRVTAPRTHIKRRTSSCML
jgi:hypothetical protein